jgi:hypothetical protein
MSTHILGAFQVYQLRMKKVGMAPGRIASPFERVVTEGLLYNIATLSLHVDLDSTMLSDFFASTQAIFQSQTYSDATPWANFPILGVGPGLYCVICQLSQLCRRVPLSPEDQGSIAGLAEDLRTACIPIDAGLALHSRDTNLGNFLLSRKLYYLAASLMLYKLQQPSVHASDEWVQSQVRQAIDILQGMPAAYSSSQHLCWPLYVFGCAVERDEDVVFVRRTMQRMWEKLYCGDAIRCAKALEGSWVARGREGGGYSGLDMLLQKRSALYR